ncbi:MAG: AMIN domain-containing protein [Betaproteobacteria bacterium]|nr:AMIN domain-containing protein [Betaproteobacteria bacterium]
MFARFFLLIAAAAAALPPAAGENLRARIWPAAEKTRLAVETSQQIEYRILSLRAPDRLVLDIVDNHNAAGFLDFLNRTEMEDAAYLGGMRAARRDAETLRIVFDINEPVNYEVRALPPVGGYGHRLIVDIAPQNAPDPLLALIESLESETATKPFRVLIDPGHGGEDPGAVSRNNIYEKDIVLAIAQKIKTEMDGRPGMRAFLTRRADRFLPLAQRVLAAHRLGVDAFISVHADSVASSRARGSSVFILSRRGASSPLARRLAKHANLSDLVGGAAADPHLNAALPAFFLDGKDRASRTLAELVRHEIAAVNPLHKKHVESAGFAVLKSPSIPSVLVETAFISNPSEEKKLRAPAFQQKIARAIVDGLQKYRDCCEVGE